MPRPSYHPDPEYARALQERRQRARLSQHALAQLCDLTETVICRMETGRTPVSPERLAVLEVVLESANVAGRAGVC